MLSLEPPFVTPLWSMVALVAGGFAALAVRRRHPRTAFAAAMALPVLSFAGGSGAEALLAVVAVHAAGVRCSAGRAWLAFGIAAAAGALGALALTLRTRLGPPILGIAPPTLPRDTLLDWVNVFALVTGVLLIAALLGMNTGHRRRHIAELVDRAERLARERDQQAEIAKALERERIAREMHDVIAHSLSVMVAISDGAHASIEQRPEEAKRAIGRVAETGRRTLGEVRRLLGAVRGEAAAGGAAAEHDRGMVRDAPQPGAADLPALVAEITAAGLPVRLAVTGVASTDPALGLTIYRIVQESLTNALRHAQGAGSASVAITWEPDEVRIAVTDSGTGAAAPSQPGRGILGMQERAALFGGTVESRRLAAGGWRVDARLLREEQAR
ncbi:sensor histidine kinase [Agrococcus sp. Marseille-P2731]|uniref:sensor histidine kinase n=1 Tax=Agrococcus sp. Marseille-P2731 TaxID=1841862 RepID=UPI00190EA1B8|nr:histidine kinase [Agrococcus sp. Marseille-P2731]